MWRARGALLLTTILLGSCAPLSYSPDPPTQPIARPSARYTPKVKEHECSTPTLIGTVVAHHVVARGAPSAAAAVVATFSKFNPQGAPTVFDLLAQVDGKNGKRWYRALLPVRPNGTSGYVPASALRLTQTRYRLVVDRQRLVLTLFKGCKPVKSFPIGLGKESTPTPAGRYYLISLLKPPNPNTLYGTFAYGLSAYSEKITNWAGGGVVGLHGTNDPASIGRRVSHGCIRMHNRDIEQLVAILPLGTPVQIT